MPNPFEWFGYSSATARVAPDLLKDLAILSDTTIRRSAAYRENLKLYIPLGDQQTYYFANFQRLY